MSAPVLASANGGLIFHWEQPRQRRFVIAGFLVASIVAHAFCFYLFQIIYPPAVSLLPPPARVNLISAATEEGRTLLRWIEAEDPALASFTQRPPEAMDAALPRLEHIPSYLNTQPELKPLPPTAPDLRVPSSQPPAPVSIARAVAISRPVSVATHFNFSDELSAFAQAAGPPATDWRASTNEPPQSAEFRVAVSGLGVVRFCFLETSSGDAALDEQAQRALAQFRFSGSARPNSPNEELIWGVATIEWGNDLAFPVKKSAP